MATNARVFPTPPFPPIVRINCVFIRLFVEVSNRECCWLALSFCGFLQKLFFHFLRAPFHCLSRVVRLFGCRVSRQAFRYLRLWLHAHWVAKRFMAFEIILHGLSGAGRSLLPDRLCDFLPRHSVAPGLDNQVIERLYFGSKRFPWHGFARESKITQEKARQNILHSLSESCLILRLQDYASRAPDSLPKGKGRRMENREAK